MKEAKYRTLFMDMAKRSAEMSYCERAKVGAVIVKDDRVIVNSWNGTITGADNCCEEACEVCRGSGKVSSYEERKCERCGGKGLTSKKTVVHAEANAILFAAKNGIKTEGCSVYVTLSPCVECSKMMIQAGIKEVIYDTEYRDMSGADFLKENGINVHKYNKKG
jgi:dCMP deaminase